MYTKDENKYQPAGPAGLAGPARSGGRTGPGRAAWRYMLYIFAYILLRVVYILIYFDIFCYVFAVVEMRILHEIS